MTVEEERRHRSVGAVRVLVRVVEREQYGRRRPLGGEVPVERKDDPVTAAGVLAEVGDGEQAAAPAAVLEVAPVDRTDEGARVARAGAMREERKQHRRAGVGRRVPEVPEEREQGGRRPMGIGPPVEEQADEAAHRIGGAILVAEIERGEHRSLAAPIAMSEGEEREGHPGAGPVAVVAAVAAERRHQVAGQAVLRAIPVEEGDQQAVGAPGLFVAAGPPQRRDGVEVPGALADVDVRHDHRRVRGRAAKAPDQREDDGGAVLLPLEVPHQREEDVIARVRLLVAAPPVEPGHRAAVLGPLAMGVAEPGEQPVAGLVAVVIEQREAASRLASSCVPPVEVQRQREGEGVVGGAGGEEDREPEIGRAGRRAPPPVKVGRRAEGAARLGVLEPQRAEERHRPASGARGVEERNDPERVRVTLVPADDGAVPGDEASLGAVLEPPVERREDQRVGGGAPVVPVERRHDAIAVGALLRPVEAEKLGEPAVAVVEVGDVRAQLDRLADVGLADVVAGAVLVALAALRGRRGRTGRLCGRGRCGRGRRLFARIVRRAVAERIEAQRIRPRRPAAWPNGSRAPARALPATQTRTTSDATRTKRAAVHEVGAVPTAGGASSIRRSRERRRPRRCRSRRPSGEGPSRWRCPP